MPFSIPDTALAQALGVTPITIRSWKRLGMPTSSKVAALDWKYANRPHRGTRTAAGQETVESPTPILPPDDGSLYSVRDRLRLAERNIASSIEALCNVALTKAIADRSMAKTPKDVKVAETKISLVQSRIEANRKEQRAAIKSLLEAEQHLVKLEKSRGALITLDAAKDLLTKTLTPLLIAIRKLPDAAQSAEESARLSAIAESFLVIIRDAATARA